MALYWECVGRVRSQLQRNYCEQIRGAFGFTSPKESDAVQLGANINLLLVKVQLEIRTTRETFSHLRYH